MRGLTSQLVRQSSVEQLIPHQTLAGNLMKLHTASSIHGKGIPALWEGASMLIAPQSGRACVFPIRVALTVVALALVLVLEVLPRVAL